MIEREPKRREVLIRGMSHFITQINTIVDHRSMYGFVYQIPPFIRTAVYIKRLFSRRKNPIENNLSQLINSRTSFRLNLNNTRFIEIVSNTSSMLFMCFAV